MPFRNYFFSLSGRGALAANTNADTLLPGTEHDHQRKYGLSAGTQRFVLNMYNKTKLQHTTRNIQCLVYRPLRKNEDEDQRVLQQDLDALKAWADKWGVRFNSSKCQIMQVKKGNSPPKLHLYELMDTVLQNVTKAKYLGVWLSSSLDRLGPPDQNCNE